MIEQEEFFSPSHKRLLNIALWAKYLGWIALIAYIVWAVLQILQYQTFANNSLGHPGGWSFLIRNDPFQAARLIADIAATVIRGVVYYLVLQGISLGLNMIIETDVNYREQEKQAGAE